jgi:hypothetical protein
MRKKGKINKGRYIEEMQPLKYPKATHPNCKWEREGL